MHGLMETVKFKKDLQCLGHRIRKRVLSSTKVFHIAMSFPFMQPLPDFRSSCFNPTSYQIVLLLSVYRTDGKRHSLLPGQFHTQQPPEEHITRRVWSLKPLEWPKTFPAPPIFILHSENRSMCTLSPKAQLVHSCSLTKAPSRLKVTFLPCLPLT